MTTTWGTVGVKDPLNTGSGTLAGTINGAALDVARAGSIAGLEQMPTPGQPARVQLAVIAALRTGGADVVAFSIAPARYQPNTELKVDFSTVVAVIYHANPQTMKFEPLGMISEGTLRLGQASQVAGGPVTATFGGTVIKPPF
jgi:hypothetical protein